MSKTSNLIVRMDEESKACVAKAAQLRQVSLSDYVRLVMVPQARREVREAEQKVISLTPQEQLDFWNALNETPVLTAAERRLGAMIRGEA